MIPKERTSRAVVNHLDSTEEGLDSIPSNKRKKKRNKQRSYNLKRCRLKNRCRLDISYGSVEYLTDPSLHRLAYFSALLGSG